MSLNYIETRDFYSDLFERKKILADYEFLAYNNKVITGLKKHKSNKKIVVSSLFPDYLQTQTHSEKQFTSVNQKLGYAINLKNYETIDEFYKSRSSNFKKVLHRSVKRLETCFNISYKMYFGNIDKETYDTLMIQLYQMIKNRFDERSGRNKVLDIWDYYQNITYSLILEKKASLFVIYSDLHPIELSISFHCDNVVYNSIASYDLNYSKFSLGNIEIYKQLEWCLTNGVSFFDMGYGDFFYKSRWSNCIYNFETHIISKKKNIITKFLAFYLKYKFVIINYLIEKGLNDKIYNLINIFKDKTKKIKTTEYVFVEVENILKFGNEVDINNANFIFLKRPFFDFLYKYSEHINQVKVFQHEINSNWFIIRGKTKICVLKPFE